MGTNKIAAEAAETVIIEGVELPVISGRTMSVAQGSEEAAKYLKRRLKKKATVADGTVVRFQSGAYTYAALFVAGYWWLTGTGRQYGARVTDEEFTNILASCTSAAVAGAWELVK